MIRKLQFIPLIVVMLVGVAGCRDDTPTAPTGGSLDGVWRIISIQPAAQAVQTAPVGAQYQVGFENDRVFLRVDCNTCTGPFTVTGSALTVGPTLACTRAACATASYENAVVSLLSGAHEVSATLHNLTLTSSRGSILLQR
jgi:heat shock protein HslJ